MVEDRRPDADWLEVGPPVLTAPQRRRRQRWTAAGLLAGLALLVPVTVHQVTHHEATPPPEPSTTETARATTASTKPGPRPVVVRAGTGALVPGAAQWDLYARSEDAVYRIALDSGRVVQTRVPSVGGTDRVSMVATRDRVLLTSPDGGPGVVVPDDGPAQPLRGLLAQPGRILPGPGDRVWFQSTVAASAPVRLVRPGTSGVAAQVPVGGSWVTTDGAGQLLLTGVGGVYRAGERATRRLTTGTVTAIGPHHFLLLGCDARFRCSDYRMDRATGRLTRLGSAPRSGIDSGVVSPDGRYAALVHWSTSGPVTGVVRDLVAGTETELDRAPSSSFSDVTDGLAWLPDSRALLMVTGGQVAVVDPATAQTSALDLGLPVLEQIALRTGSPSWGYIQRHSPGAS